MMATTAPQWIPFLPAPASYPHPEYGAVVLTPARIRRFVDQFEQGVYQEKLPLDLEHETKLSGAAAWIVAMRMNGNGSVDAKVEWTDRGKLAVEEGRFRYVSPEWFDRWTDPISKRTYKDVAIGGALTTQPFFKSLRIFSARGPGFRAGSPLALHRDPDADAETETETEPPRPPTYQQMHADVDALIKTHIAAGRSFADAVRVVCTEHPRVAAEVGLTAPQEATV